MAAYPEEGSTWMPKIMNMSGTCPARTHAMKLPMSTTVDTARILNLLSLVSACTRATLTDGSLSAAGALQQPNSLHQVCFTHPSIFQVSHDFILFVLLICDYPRHAARHRWPVSLPVYPQYRPNISRPFTATHRWSCNPNVTDARKLTSTKLLIRQTGASRVSQGLLLRVSWMPDARWKARWEREDALGGSLGPR